MKTSLCVSTEPSSRPHNLPLFIHVSSYIILITTPNFTNNFDKTYFGFQLCVYLLKCGVLYIGYLDKFTTFFFLLSNLILFLC